MDNTATNSGYPKHKPIKAPKKVRVIISMIKEEATSNLEKPKTFRVAISLVLSLKFNKAKLYNTTTASRIANILMVQVITLIEEITSSARTRISAIVSVESTWSMEDIAKAT